MTIEFTAEQYVDNVLDGSQVACTWVRLACDRHRRDLETGAARGLYFDRAAAKAAIAFFPLVLRHSKGRWARSPIWLEPWQQFALWSIFGWKRDNGLRRFRSSYLEVGRKNGKSTMAAGVGLYLMHADGEPGAEVYTAATKVEQARIIHLESIRMVKQSPLLSAELRVLKNNIHCEATFSKFEPVGSNSETLDGLNVHGALIDELHAHPDGSLYDVLETGTGSRDQPLMFTITTAGFDGHSFCKEQHDYAERVLDGTLSDDAFFALIYTMDRDDEGEIEDWENEAAWIKANPNLGVSKYADNLRDKARKAKAQPSGLNAFLTKELNIWTSARERAISPEQWAACNHGPIDEADLAGRRCWVGVDLSNTLDVTAACYVFEPGDDGIRPVIWRFWIPEDNVDQRVKRDRVRFDLWSRQGHIDLTPGNVIDDAWIQKQIEDDLKQFDLQELAFDPWNATWLSNQLQAGGLGDDRLVSFRQGYVSMNPAIQKFEAAIAKGLINHGGNPIAAWMASNLTWAMDPAGNKKPDKAKSSEKIDGMVAMIMAYYRAVLAIDTVSPYDHRGILVI